MVDNVLSGESCVVFEESRCFGRGVIYEANSQAVPVRC
jgi:hypothetical protein